MYHSIVFLQKKYKKQVYCSLFISQIYADTRKRSQNAFTIDTKYKLHFCTERLN